MSLDISVYKKDNEGISKMKDKIREPKDANDRVYPCDDCGVLRSKNEGGTTFTVCDSCWDKHQEKLCGL